MGVQGIIGKLKLQLVRLLGQKEGTKAQNKILDSEIASKY